jgi:homopolymeric O-antigen transport system permease protein
MDELTGVPPRAEASADGTDSGSMLEADTVAVAKAHVQKRWIENAPSHAWLPRLDLRELWTSRELVLILALRNIKVRYRQTALGVGWAILQPLAGVAIFTVVMHRLANVPSEGIPYPVFAYAGLAVWMYFVNGATAAAESLAQYRDLVTKVYFPRLLAPLAAILPGLIDLAISIVAVGVFMAVYGVAPTAAIVFLPFWIAAAIGTTFGVGVWLSALNARYRDVRNALSFLLQIGLFATPVLYPSSLVHGWLRVLLYINPVAGVVEGFRWSLIGTPRPGAWAVASLASGALVLTSGLVYFGRVERRLADVI